MFLSLLMSLLPGKILEEKLRYGFSQLGICACTCFNSSEGQESFNSPAKNNFVRTTFRKLRVMCDHVRKNAEASSKTKTLVQTLIIYIMKADLIKKQKRYGTCLSLHFVAASECLVQLSLFAVAMLILMGFHICYTC